MNTEERYETVRRITFDEMPSLIKDILDTLQKVEGEITLIKAKIDPKNNWFNVDKLIEYLPTPVTKRTVYDWIRYKKIPYHKQNGKVSFVESEINEWLKSDSSVLKTTPKLRAEEYIKNNARKK